MLKGIDWDGTTSRISDSLLHSNVPPGLLADAVLQSPVDLELPSLLTEPSSVTMSIANLLRKPQERSTFMRWLTGWRQEETYEPTTASVLWYECHVPHGGSAQTKTIQARSRKSSVGIRVYGYGFDTGRRTKIGITDESDPRKKCAYYYLEYLVRPVRYRNGMTQLWGAKFLKCTGERTQELSGCPFCSIRPDAIDSSQFMIGDYINRLEDTVKASKTVEMSWEKERSLSLSIPIPHLPMVSLPLRASASSKDVWNIRYEFAARSLYQGYRPLGADWEAQRWAYEKKRTARRR
jgi:hypothetical protein